MASLSASNHVARVLSVATHAADVDAESRIANSWRRCLISHKLDPARQGPPQTLTEAGIRHVAELENLRPAMSFDVSCFHGRFPFFDRDRVARSNNAFNRRQLQGTSLRMRVMWRYT